MPNRVVSSFSSLAVSFVCTVWGPYPGACFGSVFQEQAPSSAPALITITARIFMMNCTLSTFGFILFVMASISYYQHCSLSSSLQRIQFVKIWSRFAPRSIEKEKKKTNGCLEFNAYSATLCFRWRRRRQLKLTLLLI